MLVYLEVMLSKQLLSGLGPGHWYSMLAVLTAVLAANLVILVWGGPGINKESETPVTPEANIVETEEELGTLVGSEKTVVRTTRTQTKAANSNIINQFYLSCSTFIKLLIVTVRYRMLLSPGYWGLGRR